VKDYAIFMLDTEGHIASWNQGAARIKGYSADEILGKHFSIFYTPEEVASGKCEYELKEAALTGRFEDEGWRVRKDGTMLWASVVITAIRDRSNKLIGFTKVTRDLTERKRAEDRLQRAYADLERRVNERTADLALANTELARREGELKEAVRVRDEFLSIASHELKTPITSLKMQLQILQARTKPGQTEGLSPERVAKAVDVSLRQVDRLTRLIEDLLDVARSQAKKMTFTFEPLDLEELVEEVVERYAAQLETARCHVQILANEPVIGNFDRFRLDQVLVNLLTNAVKYAPGSKVTVSIKKVLNSAQIVVADDGPGIAEESRQRLFQRFERGSNSQNIGGLGLGLFIAKQIVSGHRGSIRVESALGQGTRFIIDLPLTLPAESGVKAAAQEAHVYEQR
jgi:PAS domain S-box-containing protein